jgi:hypothetical protein
MNTSIALKLMEILEVWLHENDIAGSRKLETCAEKPRRANKKLVVLLLFSISLLVLSIREGLNDFVALALLHSRIERSDATVFIFDISLDKL